MTAQLIWLFILPLAIACIAWTVTHEEVFREPRDYCKDLSETSPTFIKRKFFYLFTCEYCFSHYVTIFMLIITGYKLMFNDWRGYIISGFALVWVANIYMSLFGLLRQNIKLEQIKSKVVEKIESKKEISEVEKL